MALGFGNCPRSDRFSFCFSDFGISRRLGLRCRITFMYCWFVSRLVVVCFMEVWFGDRLPSNEFDVDFSGSGSVNFGAVGRLLWQHFWGRIDSDSLLTAFFL